MTPHRPPSTGARGRAIIGMSRVVSGVLFSLGLLGLLKSGTDNSPEQLFVFTIHPFTALVWLVLGLVGIAMSVAPERAQLYLVGTGVILLVWAALCLALGGRGLADRGARHRDACHVPDRGRRLPRRRTRAPAPQAVAAHRCSGENRLTRSRPVALEW